MMGRVRTDRQELSGQVRRSQPVPEMDRLFASWKKVWLRSLAIVTFQDATEFAFATNLALGLRREVFVENVVVSA